MSTEETKKAAIEFSAPYVARLQEIRERWPEASKRCFWRVSRDFLAQLMLQFGVAMEFKALTPEEVADSQKNPQPTTFCGIPARVDSLMPSGACELALEDHMETMTYVHWVMRGCPDLSVRG